MGHLFLQALGAAVTISGAPGCWMQTEPVSPSPTWETQAPWSWCGVVAPVLLGLDGFSLGRERSLLWGPSRGGQGSRCSGADPS